MLGKLLSGAWGTERLVRAGPPQRGDSQTPYPTPTWALSCEAAACTPDRPCWGRLQHDHQELRLSVLHLDSTPTWALPRVPALPVPGPPAFPLFPEVTAPVPSRGDVTTEMREVYNKLLETVPST